MKFSAKRGAALAALVTTASVALWAVSSFAQNAAGPFTQGQVDTGKQVFMANCAVCHTDNLSGSGEAVPIAGPAFMASFGGRTSKDLFDTIKAEMPFGAAGSLTDEQYTNLTALLLYASGAKPGPKAFTPTTAVKISTIANGSVP